ncbi:hypothetical protein SCE1572_39985 [Sorangium cellulosum So0157-2]|uniref:Uncharacterized protein n=1 Tax=Sorangium cellulosum So0157-2 TaxID=1254432 RepID=S4Y6S6_SORCE|nr:hypothetical protein SCE1572_39985 [Sorangium cellulosum So0157-2]
MHREDGVRSLPRAAAAATGGRSGISKVLTGYLDRLVR